MITKFNVGERAYIKCVITSLFVDKDGAETYTAETLDGQTINIGLKTSKSRIPIDIMDSYTQEE